MLPGAFPEALVEDIEVYRAVLKYPGRDAEYEMPVWVMRFPFSEPCKVKLKATILAGALPHEVTYESKYWGQEHVVLIGSEPWISWRKVTIQNPGFFLKAAVLDVTSSGGETAKVVWP